VARPKAFDTMVALDAAVEVFWRYGFEGASINRLLDEMKISRASMYSTYGDKDALFTQALSRYHARIIGPLLEPLFDRSVEGARALQSVLSARIDQLFDDTTPAGCLIAVASVECGHNESSALERQLLDMLADFESGFYQAVRRAQIDGVVDKYEDPLQLGRVFANHAQGLAVMARSGAERRVLLDLNRWMLVQCGVLKG